VFDDIRIDLTAGVIRHTIEMTQLKFTFCCLKDGPYTDLHPENPSCLYWIQPEHNRATTSFYKSLPAVVIGPMA